MGGPCVNGAEPRPDTAEMRVLDGVTTSVQEAKIENPQVDRAVGGVQHLKARNRDRNHGSRTEGSIEYGRTRERAQDGSDIPRVRIVVAPLFTGEVQSGGGVE